VIGDNRVLIDRDGKIRRFSVLSLSSNRISGKTTLTLSRSTTSDARWIDAKERGGKNARSFFQRSIPLAFTESSQIAIESYRFPTTQTAADRNKA